MIWRVYPSACIRYNYKKIMPEMSNAQMNLEKDSIEKVNGLEDILVYRAPPKPSARYISVWTKLREGQKAFEENRKKLDLELMLSKIGAESTSSSKINAGAGDIRS